MFGNSEPRKDLRKLQPALRDLFESCIEQEPGDRPQRFDDVIAVLRLAEKTLNRPVETTERRQARMANEAAAVATQQRGEEQERHRSAEEQHERGKAERAAAEQEDRERSRLAEEQRQRTDTEKQAVETLVQRFRDLPANQQTVVSGASNGLRADMRQGEQVLNRLAETAEQRQACLPHKVGDIWSNTVGMKFAYIPAGKFVMGSPNDEVEREGNLFVTFPSALISVDQGTDETQHGVTITKPFMMGVHLVTRGQFAAFVNGSGYKTEADYKTESESVGGRDRLKPGFEQDDNHPVVYVSWNDAQAFVHWLRHKEAKPYRLPTEAQWEYACRARTTTPFHFGPTLSTEQANYDGSSVYGSGNKGVFRRKTMPVGSFPPNHWGLYDMHGNAWEWCEDLFGAYPKEDVADPVGPLAGALAGTSRVLRGGSWDNFPRHCRSAYRRRFAPVFRSPDAGFRLCLDLP